MNIQETITFLSQISQGDFNQIGAILPTSRKAAQALTAESLRQKKPKVILEVGPGTGPITAEIVRHMKADDRLVLCEINPEFVAYLNKRFENEPELRRVRHQVEILCKSATDLDGEHVYDYIVSSVPFTRLPAEVTREILTTYQRLLKPGGSLSFLEYSFLRQLRKMHPALVKGDFLKVDQILNDFIGRYQFRNERVLMNLPPADVRHLRFSDPPRDAAADLLPREHYRRLGPRWSNIGMAAEGIDMVAGLGLLSAYLKRRGSKFWPVVAGMSAVAAWFHRDPHREVAADRTVAYAASDGTVMKVDVIRHPRLGDQSWARIAVFLSPLDVHINRSPVAGTVVDRWEEPGGFMPAYNDASERNSSRILVIDGPHGKCAVAQRAGFLARRIITWPTKGELLAQGERIGLIRLGSRTDLFFPVDRVEVAVKAGDKVVAGQTVVAKFL